MQSVETLLNSDFVQRGIYNVTYIITKCEKGGIYNMTYIITKCENGRIYNVTHIITKCENGGIYNVTYIITKCENVLNIYNNKSAKITVEICIVRSMRY